MYPIAIALHFLRIGARLMYVVTIHLRTRTAKGEMPSNMYFKLQTAHCDFSNDLLV